MTSSKGRARERQLARAKYERQLARRAAGARRRRQLKAGVGILLFVLAGFAVAWLLGAFDGPDKAEKNDDPTDEPSATAPASDEAPTSGDDKSGDQDDKATTSADESATQN